VGLIGNDPISRRLRNGTLIHLSYKPIKELDAFSRRPNFLNALDLTFLSKQFKDQFDCLTPSF